MVGPVRIAAVFLLSLLIPAQTSALHGDTWCLEETEVLDTESANCYPTPIPCFESCSQIFRVIVTKDPSLTGLATVGVQGSINGERVCSGMESCTGTYEWGPASFLADMWCAGRSMIPDGLFISVSRDAFYATQSMRVECYVESSTPV